jgi:hypothetical protein
MASVHKPGIMSVLRDRVSLPASTSELALSYRSARPFPHIVLDNMFPDQMLEGVLGEIPSMNDNKWFHEDCGRLTKSNPRSALDLGEAGYQFQAFVTSAKFLYLISELTGIWALLPDPYMEGAGYHVVPAGGKFDMHTDSNIGLVSGLRRCLAMLVYLNKNWKTEYGGQLELWDTAGSRCEKVVEPTFNRTILFEVADQNFHGVRPVLDKDCARTSFATYYHTVPVANLAPNNTIYVPSFYVKKEPFRRRLMNDWMPPVLSRAVRRLRGRK